MLSKRLSTMLLTGAAAAGLAATAQASLTISVVAVSKNGVALSGADTPNHVNVAVGDIIRFNIYADVSGSDAAKSQTLQSTIGSLLSTGGIEGPLSNLALRDPWKGLSSSVGIQQDLDGDGDLDIGSNNTGATSNDYIAYRSSYIVGPRSTTSSSSIASSFDPADLPVFLNPNTVRYVLTRNFRFTVASLGSDTAVNWRPRVEGELGTSFENANETATTVFDIDDNPIGTAYTYSGGVAGDVRFVGQPVILSVIPEPATLGLMSVAGLGLLARRRK